MRTIDADVLKESLQESRDYCRLWWQDCKEAKSKKWTGRAEQALLTFNECIMRVDTIPTIEPVRTTGNWIEGTKRDNRTTCSVCGCWQDITAKFLFSFCPNCGADMRKTP